MEDIHRIRAKSLLRAIPKTEDVTTVQEIEEARLAIRPAPERQWQKQIRLARQHGELNLGHFFRVPPIVGGG